MNNDSELRRLAEETLKKRNKQISIKDLSNEELLHELQVYQIELEMQNKELQIHQRELEEAKSKYKKLYDNSPVGYITFDKEGKILNINPRIEKIFDMKKDLLINKYLYPYLSEYSNNILKTHFNKVKGSNNKISSEIELRKLAMDKLKYLIIESVKFEYEDEVYIYSAIIDITERKEAEELNRKSKELAEESIKIKNDFLANASHELYTPLSGIIGLSSTLLNNKSLSDKDKEAICVINDSGKRLLKLIDDMLNYSRIRDDEYEQNIETLAMDRLINEIDRFMKPLIKKRDVSFRIINRSFIPENLLVDTSKVKKILLNILENAVKFTDSGSIVLDILYIKNEDYDNKIKFTVKDTGIGIDEQYLRFIFREFQQIDSGIKRKYTGLGIGLTLSKKLADIISGKIEIKSEPGKGTTVDIYIPVTEDKIFGKMSNVKSEQSAKNSRKKKILLADDERLIQMSTKLMIEDMFDNIEILLASNGNQALEIYERDKPDLVLLDIMMPEKDGFEVLEEIKNKYKSPSPIIACTARSLPKDKEEMSKKGFDDYITKPIDDYELSEKIKKYLNPKGSKTK